MLLKTIKKAKKKGLKIGFTASSFDLLHAGHVIMLEECKNHCDFLIVGLLTDPTISRPEIKNKPVQSTLERWLQVQTLKHIDLLVPFDTELDLYNLLTIIMPDVRFVGEEYEHKDFTGRDLPIEIYYNRREHNYSSREVRSRVENSLKACTGCGSLSNKKMREGAMACCPDNNYIPVKDYCLKSIYPANQ